jgi:carbon storage regulator CsrA
MEDFRMLVLTRKLGEKILIGNDITITVVDIGQSRLKLGIEAPADHRILRSELAVDTEPLSPSSGAGGVAVRTEIVPRRRSRPRWESEVAEPIGA